MKLLGKRCLGRPGQVDGVREGGMGKQFWYVSI